VLAMAVVLGYGLWQNIGNQEVPPEPDSTESDSDPGAELPPELRYVFIGQPHEVTGIDVGDRLVLDFRNQVMAVHTGASATAIGSRATVTDAGALRLETLIEGTGCEAGDIGVYPYSLSPGGTVLTIDTGDEDCASRADALAGEWRRSACRSQDNWCLGELEAGSQASLFFDPYLADYSRPVTRYGAMTYEVPDGWANADDRTHFYTLMRASAYQETGVMGCLDCPDNIWFGANPRAIRLDCSEEVADEAIGASAEALADWIRANPGLQVNEGPAMTVDGRQAFVLDITGSEEYADACVDPELRQSFVPLFIHPGYTYAIGVGDRHRLILVEIDADTAMLIAMDTLRAGDIDTMAAEVQPILDSIELTAP
jgi:hypothetical protein